MSCHTGRYSIYSYDGDNIAIRLAYGTTELSVSNGTSHTEDDAITICVRQADTMRIRVAYRLSLGRKHIATENGSLRAFKTL